MCRTHETISLCAGDICLAAFGHYTFLKFSLHDVLKTPINGVVGPTPKCVPQTMLLCPAISRLFVTYGTQAETSKAGVHIASFFMSLFVVQKSQLDD